MYSLLTHLALALLEAAAPFQPKLRQWVDGRRHWRTRYPERFQKTKQVLWLHAASLGEFEQGRPVMEAWRAAHPDWQIVLTFFSPSGYSLRHNYAQADAVLYLPADTRKNARDFVDWLKPDVAVFVKYEFWHHYLHTLAQRGTPTLLISALFRPDQPFFRAYGRFWRQMLHCFTHFFVQNEASAQLLLRLGHQNVTVAGDTRIDRVLQLAQHAPENPIVATFVSKDSQQVGEQQESHTPSSTHNAPPATLILGSAWPADEDIVLAVLAQPEFAHYKAVIAPHEPSNAYVAAIRTKMQGQPHGCYSTYRTAAAGVEGLRFLIIDNVGMLNTLYRYGEVAYIGGGFGRGIHNTLEPAAYGLPIIFGPKYQKFEEANQLVARGGAFSVGNKEALARVLRHLADPVHYNQASAAVKAYLAENKGATQTIVQYLEQVG